MKFSVFDAIRHLVESDSYFMIETMEAIVSSQSGLTYHSFEPNRRKYYDQKPLPNHLRYAYMRQSSTLLVIISASLT